MSATNDGGQNVPASPRRPIGVAIVACLSAIVLGSLLAVVLLTGEGDKTKANERPVREKVDAQPAKVDAKGEQGEDSTGQQGQQQYLEPTTPVDPALPIDPYSVCDPSYADPACSDYGGAYYDDGWWLDPLPSDESGSYDDWLDDTELDELSGATP